MKASSEGIDKVKVKNVLDTEVNPATEEKQDDLLAQIEVLEGIVGQIQADIATLNAKDFATEVTLLDIQTGVRSLEIVRIDQADATTTYFGWAAAGQAENDSVWKIKRLSISGNVTSINFADGDVAYDNIWDNRAALTYS